jgi:hypothetical protein
LDIFYEAHPAWWQMHKDAPDAPSSLRAWQPAIKTVSCSDPASSVCQLWCNGDGLRRPADGHRRRASTGGCHGGPACQQDSCTCQASRQCLSPAYTHCLTAPPPWQGFLLRHSLVRE